MANNLKSLFTFEDDLFYFESDHLALKGNKNYCEVLKTVVVLSALREKAIKDFNKVVELRKDAVEHPFKTLEKIQNGTDLGVPVIAELPKIPVINFKKFDVSVPEEELNFIYADTYTTKSDEELKNVKQNNGNNRVWTPEEQKRLEELLVTYPPEPIEMRRFQKKIAKALGNRTVQQVTSRVQKYFLKLYKAGLPIPGRIPKSSEKYKKSVLHKHQRHNHYLWKPTTFFPDLFVPVVMNDLENTPGPSVNPCSASASASATSSSSNYLLPGEYHRSGDACPAKTEPELQLDLLKRIRTEKVREQEGNPNVFQHVGYKCDYCEAEPVVGSRWHCATCADSSVDYCTDCLLAQMYGGNAHPLRHAFLVYRDEADGTGADADAPLSDSDSCAGSVAARNYESDSNFSGEFEPNGDHRSVYESGDVGLENAGDYSSLLDLDESNVFKFDDGVEMDAV
ncbi:hypothetical protein NQ318_016911 [Aromia moschata]|uniref:ZZ-type domain-containing protein n=1 Tax=Aromia moschata TaxID=1265417 RepID=A0AAV8XIE1_9CUCU|nr:hypothetical protein NQ318_016911 [Aromia moschata]